MSLKGDNSYHDRAEWGQLVVQCPGLGDVTGLERDLKTATAHPKAHTVHVNVVRLGPCLGLSIIPQGLEVVQVGRPCVLVLVHCQREHGKLENRQKYLKSYLI